MNLQEFGQSIKKKYPQYANVDDVELANKTIEKYPTYKSQVSDYVEPQEQDYLSKIVSNLKKTFTKGASDITTAIQNEPTIANRASTQGDNAGILEHTLATGATAGHLAGTIASTAGGIIGSLIEPALPEGAKKTIGNVANYIDEQIKSVPGMTPEIHKSLGDVFNTLTLLGGGKTATAAKDLTIKTAENIAETTAKTAQKVKNVVHTVAEQAPQMAEKAATILSSEPGAQIKTILQETPRSVFDDYLKVAQEASLDPRKTSVFEKVSEKVVDATKQLESQKKSLGAQKVSLIEKAKVGLQPFTEAPRQAILKVMKLAENPLKNQIIQKLKSIKNKMGADKVIDEVQDMIYSAGRTNLIAEGSAIERQLRGIIGEMNTTLKNSLPEAYRTLNLKYAERIKIIDTLNRALGEMVDGVPTRGAGLVKQFFSPAGTKTKELFDFIKRNTAIDLAQETTLARFLGELFNDPKIKSLLEGLPTTQRGLIEKGVRFIAEKTGVGQKLRESIQKGSIEKGRELTK